MRLIDIRSIIFDQLFEILCPKSVYKRTDWFRNAKSKSDDKKKRYCQAKYFILGRTVFSSLNPIEQNDINKVCKHMYDLFNKLGSVEYVKNKAIDHCKKAINALNVLQDTDARNILMELANYTISREK